MATKIGAKCIKICGNSNASCSIATDSFEVLLNEHRLEDPLTLHIETMAKNYVQSDFPQKDTQLLIRIICAWGGIRGKNPKRLYNRNKSDNFCRMTHSLRAAHGLSLNGEYGEAIRTLDWTEGAQISFRSKFLKFICPDHAAVLDSNIQKVLGYRRTPAGYEEFVQNCAEVRTTLNNSQMNYGGVPKYWRTSDVEMAIFQEILKPQYDHKRNPPKK